MEDPLFKKNIFNRTENETGQEKTLPDVSPYGYSVLVV